MFRAAGASVAGPGHVQSGQPNQDALSLRGWQGGWIAAIADGLGSKPFSSQGARWAVQCAQRVLRHPDWSHASDREVVSAIYRLWLSGVSAIDPGSGAATLLIAACQADGLVRLFQIGDGLILVRTASGMQVITPDRTGFGNQTAALGVTRSWSSWTTASVQLSQPGDLVLLMTDGISDDVDACHLEDFAVTVRRELAKRTRRGCRSWLRHEMTHWATPGHSDDKTMAMIFKDGVA